LRRYSAGSQGRLIDRTNPPSAAAGVASNALQPVVDR